MVDFPFWSCFPFFSLACLGENEDWMHAILEGLPQLSVSDRTLNNVLEKSVRQIKSLTSNYEESKQRKSREAQFQVSIRNTTCDVCREWMIQFLGT